MKKFMTALMVALIAMTMAVSSASATAGWQTVARYYVSNGDSSFPNLFATNNHDAPDMGSFAVYISDHRVLYNSDSGFKNFIRIDLWEDDGTSGSDDFIGSAYYYPDTMGAKQFVFNVDGYGDGVGLNPELYVRTTATYGYSNFQLTLQD